MAQCLRLCPVRLVKWFDFCRVLKRSAAPQPICVAHSLPVDRDALFTAALSIMFPLSVTISHRQGLSLDMNLRISLFGSSLSRVGLGHMCRPGVWAVIIAVVWPQSYLP